MKIPTLVSGSPWAGPQAYSRLVVVVQHQHGKARAVAGLRVLQHLFVAGQITEGGVGPKPDHEVDAFGFAGIVIVKQHKLADG